MDRQADEHWKRVTNNETGPLAWVRRLVREAFCAGWKARASDRSDDGPDDDCPLHGVGDDGGGDATVEEPTPCVRCEKPTTWFLGTGFEKRAVCSGCCEVPR